MKWVWSSKVGTDGKKTCSRTTQMFTCLHIHTYNHLYTHSFGSKLPNTLTLPFISSPPSSKVAQQQKAPLSQAWQSAIFNPLRMIIEFALIPFQRRLPSNAPITTLVTSDPAPVPHACGLHSLHQGLGVWECVEWCDTEAFVPHLRWNGTDWNIRGSAFDSVY